MDWIYPVSYLASLSGLLLWFIAHGNRRISRMMSAVFLISFLVYLTALSLASGTVAYKLLILLRDMLVMGVVSQLFNVFRKNVLVSMAMGLAAALILYFSYFQTLSLSFPQFPAETLDSGGEFLMEIGPGNEDILHDIAARFPCSVEKAFHPADPGETTLDDYYVINLQSDRRRNCKQFYKFYRHAHDVLWIEPNEVITVTEPTATLPVRNSTKHFLNDPGIGMQWGFEPMDVDQLHRTLSASGARPKKQALIAILDSGVDATHEDLQQNYLSTSEEYDSDPLGHGTHCAGIAGAVSNNAIGIASFSPGTGYVRLTSIRVINARGAGTQKAIIDGMIKAVDQGADVISLSLGGPSSQSKQKAYEDAVEYAGKHHCIVVVAAGNNASNARNISPANVKGVIAVSATDKDNKRATFSNTVNDLAMGIAAPGTDIYSTLPGNRYGPMSGTSMSTPYVAGLIGLMKSFRPEMTTKQAYLILKSTGKSTVDGSKTGPLIQPFAALEKVLD